MNITLKRGENKKLSDHFNSSEFECPCGSCKVFVLDSDLVDKLEFMRRILGTSLKITSGFRCYDYQEQLAMKGYDTAKGISQHELGHAADVTNGVALGHELEEAARDAGFMAVGTGQHWVHVDLRADKFRAWKYAY